MKKHVSLLAAFIMMAVTLMPLEVFAIAQDSQATHDPVEDMSSDTATVYIGKVLTVNQNNKFPDISDFNFEMEAIRAWDNANVKSDVSGKDISVDDMPVPIASNTAHQTVVPRDTTAAVTVGDFKGAANTSVADTSVEKYRATPVRLKFTKAGYYLYSVTESGSVPADVPGMDYDPNSYYIAIYVCNKTDEDGNTLPGVYVHDITSFRNTEDTDYMPDFSDIQNVTDNNGTAASENTYFNFEKTGKSVPPHPDVLEAYRFWNDQTTHDVVITKNVTGNLGDITKEFEMTVTLTGLEKNVTYTTNIPAEFKTEKNVTSEGADLVSASKGSINAQNKTFRSDDAGNAEFIIRLKDEEVLVLNALPATSTYKVEEHATDHVASYQITSTSDTAVIAREQNKNSKDGQSLSTDVETVDAVSNVRRSAPVTKSGKVDNNDETVTIAFTNHRNLAVITGLPYYGDFTYVLGALIIAAAAILFVSRRNKNRKSLIKS